MESNRMTSDFDIKIGGKSLISHYGASVNKVAFDEQIEETGKLEFTINYNDSSNVAPQLFFAGNPVELLLGNKSEMISVFIGEIVSVTPGFGKQSPSTIKIVCYDVSYRLKKDNSYRVFTSITPNQIINRARMKYDDIVMRIDVPKLKRAFKIGEDQSIVFENKTDWELYNELAKLGGYRLFVFNGILYMVDDDYILKTLQNDRFTFIYNPHHADSEIENMQELEYFTPAMKSIGQKAQVEIVSWKARGNSNKATRIKLGQGIPGKEHSTEIVVNYKGREEKLIAQGTVADNEEQARMIAESMLKERAERLITGEASIVKGNPLLRMGQRHNIILRDMGDFGIQYSGEYFISGTRHTILEDEGYKTTFEFRRDNLTALEQK